MPPGCFQIGRRMADRMAISARTPGTSSSRGTSSSSAGEVLALGLLSGLAGEGQIATELLHDAPRSRPSSGDRLEPFNASPRQAQNQPTEALKLAR